MRLDGWLAPLASVKAIASYMKVSRTTVYRVIGRWLDEGEAGLEDRPEGRPKGAGEPRARRLPRPRRPGTEGGRRGERSEASTVGRIMAVYRALGIEKEQIERRKAYQSYSTVFDSLPTSRYLCITRFMS